MIHRYLHDILTEGIAAILASPLILDELFQDNYELVSTEAAAIKTYFTTNGFNVHNGYPRTDTKYPSINIILGDEAEVESVLADTGGDITDENDPNYKAEILTAIWSHTYRLLVMTDHPDVTAYYYEIAKFILLEGFHDLIDDGMFEFELSGNELAPDPRYIPEHLFARQLIFSCQREFQRIGRARQRLRGGSISGLHVDSSGSKEDVGDVKTNVTTYVE